MFEKIKLQLGRYDATLRAYVPTQSYLSSPLLRPAILICPGGGYHCVVEREAEPIALHFLSLGYACFVLEYSIAPEAHFPVSLQQTALAMQHIRRHSKEWSVDEKRIFIMGFSAGGHLAASLGVLWNTALVSACVPPEDARPDGMVLCYPVITSGELAHRGSIVQLLGDNADNQELLHQVSLEEQVSQNTVPTFLWHTVPDPTVPVENSMLFASSLRRNNIPFELHLFPTGGHGLSLATKEVGMEEKCCAQWTVLADRWMKTVC